MKVAIMYDERDGWYYAHRYNWLFKLFGANPLTYITLAGTENGLVGCVERKLRATINLIRIVEI